MNVKSIINQAIDKCKININPVAGRKMINEAMDVLAVKYDTACIKKETTFKAIENNLEFELPSDCIGVIRVKSENDNRFKGYTADNSGISFDFPGNFTVTYLSIPQLADKEVYNYTLQDEVPAVNLAFHAAIPFYLAHRTIIDNEKEVKDLNKIKLNSQKSSTFLQEFDDISAEANKKLMRIKRRSINIPPPLWR